MDSSNYSWSQRVKAVCAPPQVCVCLSLSVCVCVCKSMSVCICVYVFFQGEGCVCSEKVVLLWRGVKHISTAPNSRYPQHISPTCVCVNHGWMSKREGCVGVWVCGCLCERECLGLCVFVCMCAWVLLVYVCVWVCTLERVCVCVCV